MIPSGMMNPPRGKLPLPIIIATISALALFAILYAERLSFFSSSYVLKFKTCPRRNSKPKSNDKKAEEEVVNVNASLIDDRFDFDPEECNVANGNWVFNRSIKPLYSDRSCPYVDSQFSCVENGRSDSDYLRWEWQPEDCTLPRAGLDIDLRSDDENRLLCCPTGSNYRGCNHSKASGNTDGHAQFTPLHVSNTMLAANNDLLRMACLQSHSHPLQCKALELCLNVVLNRLPASNSSPILASHSHCPSISNTLAAAFK